MGTQASRRPRDNLVRAAVYCRVSTREQGDSGLGIEAQRARCLAELSARGWDLARLVEEQATSGKARPKLVTLMREMDLKLADALIVSRLDRLSRSVIEFGKFVERSQAGGWSLVVLDPAIDLSTPSGRMMGNVLASVAQWEREMGSQRTRDALAAKRARGEPAGGVPAYSDRETIRRIVRLRGKGMSVNRIADWLTDHDVPSPWKAPTWNHKTVRKILQREGVE